MHGSLPAVGLSLRDSAGEDGTSSPFFLVGCHTEIHRQARRGRHAGLAAMTPSPRGQGFQRRSWSSAQ